MNKEGVPREGEGCLQMPRPMEESALTPSLFKGSCPIWKV